MSSILFKFIQRLGTPAPVNLPLAAGDRVDEALNKLQGQISSGTGGGGAGSPTLVAASTTFKVPKNQQVLFTDPIEMESGAEIDFEDNAVLAEVN